MAAPRDPISHDRPAPEPGDTSNSDLQGSALLTADDYDFTPAEFVDEPEPEVKRRTVLHGYGRLHPAKRHYIDEVEFLGGVAIHVPLERVTTWQEKGNVKVKSLPDVDFRIKRVEDVPLEVRVTWAKAIGVKPMEAKKLAALLSAADYDQLVSALGVSRTKQLLEELEKRLSEKRSR